MQSYKGRNVLVTGGAGCIGQALVRALRELSAVVTVIDALLPNSGADRRVTEEWAGDVTFYEADIRDIEALRPVIAKQEILFHLAGRPGHLESMQDPAEDMSINGTGHLPILDICRQENPDASIVYAGSREVCGQAVFLPVDETHPIAPLDAHGISKAAGEQYHLSYHRLYGLKTCVLRLPNVYGPHENRFDMMGVFLRLAADGKPLTVFGTGQQIRDFLYVDDAASALLLAGISDATIGHAWMIGGSSLSVAAMAKMLADIAGVSTHFEPFPPERAAIEPGDFSATHARFHAATGWLPTVDSSEGLRASLSFFRHASHGHPALVVRS